jgi:hypothetical protein
MSDPQQIIYAKARGVMNGILPSIDDEQDPQVALVALMLATAKTCRRMGLDDLKAVEILAGNIPGMMEMWEQAEAGLENVISVNFGKQE